MSNRSNTRISYIDYWMQLLASGVMLSVRFVATFVYIARYMSHNYRQAAETETETET